MFAVLTPAYHRQNTWFTPALRKVLSRLKLARGQENNKVPDKPREERHTR